MCLPVLISLADDVFLAEMRISVLIAIACCLSKLVGCKQAVERSISEQTYLFLEKPKVE
jgi:hypothetical protein